MLARGFARLIESAIAVWGIVTVVFFVTRVLGDPAVLLVPVGASAAQIAELRTALGLDQPLYEQYFRFLGGIMRGDFGMSFQHNRPALEVVLERMPATATLAACAMAIGLTIGMSAGGLAAMRRGRPSEGVVSAFALVGQATPTFWLGLMLILVFAVQLSWLPPGGAATPAGIVLPAVTLGVYVAASIARLFRSSLVDTLREDYVRTARAKGLSPRKVFFWHLGRNAVIPVVTMSGIITGELLGGSVVTETVFAWPGVGRLIVQAVEAKDFPVIQAGVAVIAVTFVVINALIDGLYSRLDPRIQGAS